MKKYNLNLKKVFILLIISALFVMFALYMMFIASDEEQYNMHLTELKYSLTHDTSVFGSVYICGFFSFFILIRMLALLIYKIKDVLILEEKGITYYSPKYRKAFIPKDKIKDIYITDRGQMKILLKEKIYYKNIFIINLNLIKCDIKEIREALMDFNLDSGSSEAKEEITAILEEYNYSNIEDLKKDKKALAECVMKLYNMEKFTQVEISAIMRISTSKVSKIIRNNLN